MTMKKLILLASFWLLAGCALVVPLTATPAVILPSLPPSETLTPSPTFTLTPTVPSPTFTPVPTLIYPTSSGTRSLDFPTPTPTPLMYFLPKESGFFSVVVSPDVVFWGGCEPSEMVVAARVIKPENVAYVTLFLRYANQVTGVTSDWLPYISMQDAGFGLYQAVVNVNELERKFYSPSWLELQLVATSARLKIVGRTEILRKVVAFFPCP
jgi:hypothetical protein